MSANDNLDPYFLQTIKIIETLMYKRVPLMEWYSSRYKWLIKDNVYWFTINQFNDEFRETIVISVNVKIHPKKLLSSEFDDSRYVSRLVLYKDTNNNEYNYFLKFIRDNVFYDEYLASENLISDDDMMVLLEKKLK